MFLMNIIRDIADPNPINRITYEGPGLLVLILGGLLLLALIGVAAFFIVKKIKNK